jgi:hypothetical protein
VYSAATFQTEMTGETTQGNTSKGCQKDYYFEVTSMASLQKYSLNLTSHFTESVCPVPWYVYYSPPNTINSPITSGQAFF